MVMNAHSVAPDIYQVRIPLPYLLNHVYCYLLRDSAGWAIVDTGLNWPEARAAWEACFEQLEINPKTDIQKIVVTHMHPDHFGMAGWFQAQSGAPVYLSAHDRDTALRVWYEWPDRSEEMRVFFQKCALSEDKIREVIAAGDDTAQLTTPLPDQLERIEGDTITIGDRNFRVIPAQGHSDGQVLFYHEPEGLMISGDQVLMKITPNIGVWPETAPAPLARYLASLASLHELPVKLALPGHKTVIHHWQARIKELQAHHEDRLALLQKAVTSNTTVFEAMCKIFDMSRLTSHEVRFALAETLAHLEYLRDAGRIGSQDTGDTFLFHG